MATSTKIGTLVLKRYDLIHVTAGHCAALDDYPWWCAFGYAAAAVGVSDAQEVFQAAIAWLQGWLPEYEKAHGAKAIPKYVRDLIEAKL